MKKKVKPELSQQITLLYRDQRDWIKNTAHKTHRSGSEVVRDLLDKEMGATRIDGKVI